MDTLHWDCSLCSSQNDTALTNCSFCDSPRPLLNPQPLPNPQPPHQGNRNQRRVPSYSSRRPVQLFSICHDRIVQSQDALRILQRNFDANKPICVVTAEGRLGVGKTTWLNQILHCSENLADDPSGMFKIGHSQETETEGLWMYPFPIHLDNVQLLLLDMEGIGGIVEGNAEAHKSALKKQSVFCFIASCILALHSPFRTDDQTIDIIEETFSIAKELKQEFQIDPEVQILVQDCEVPVRKNGGSFRDFLLEKCPSARSLGEKFQVYGRPVPPDGFTTALKGENVIEAFELLKGSKSESFNQKFLNDCNSKPKMKPGCQEPMILNELVEYFKKIAEIVNYEEFQVLFRATLDQRYIEQIQPIKQEFLEKYNAAVEALALNFPMEKELVDFQAEIPALRSQAKDYLLEEIQKKLSIDIKQNRSIQREIALFIISLKNNTYDQSFLLRKLQHASAKEKGELMQQMEEMKASSEKTQMALQNLEKKSQQDQEQMKTLLAESAKKDSQHQLQMLQQQRTFDQEKAHSQRTLEVERAQRAAEKNGQEKLEQEQRKNKQLEENARRMEWQYKFDQDQKKKKELEEELSQNRAEIRELKRCPIKNALFDRCQLEKGHFFTCSFERDQFGSLGLFQTVLAVNPLPSNQGKVSLGGFLKN